MFAENAWLFFRKKNWMKIFAFSSGEDFLKALPDANVLLLDIELGGISGIDIKNLLEKNNNETRLFI
jgi:FixJ family two-component response regulator